MTAEVRSAVPGDLAVLDRERLGYTDTGRRWVVTYRYFDGTGTAREATEHVHLLGRPL